MSIPTDVLFIDKSRDKIYIVEGKITEIIDTPFTLSSIYSCSKIGAPWESDPRLYFVAICATLHPAKRRELLQCAR